MSDDWQEIQDAVSAWADKAFPTETLAGKMEHIRRETHEIEENPDDIIEWADVMLIFLNAMADENISMADLKAGVLAKFVVVQHREWNEPDSDGVVEHKRDQANE